MKIVINKCFGGFSLSPKAIKRLAELRGLPCYFFKTDYKTHTHIPVEDPTGLFLWSAYTVPNPDEVLPSQANWHELTMEERQASNEKWSSVSLESRPDKRDDPLLIQVVGELGDEASGAHARLAIVEIPDGMEWEISEYDGRETIEQKHLSWS